MANDVSTRLKAVRLMHRLSQRELAKRAGVTNGMISLIEQGRASPSVATLKKVLDGISMQLAEFFTMDAASTPQVFHARKELVELGEGGVSLRLVAAHRPGRRMAVPQRFRNRGRERCEIISAATPPTL
jgi:transcriptional regulator with XRE-family HTH domain